MEIIASHGCFGGTVTFYRHRSLVNNCDMRFSAFIPPQAEKQKCPTLFFLSGLTATEENFTVKSGAFRLARELGLIIIVPDTSPRGEHVPTGENSELGKGAGFYLNATQDPWKTNYQMDSYITQELRGTVIRELPVDGDRLGIFGHSMGGHGAIVLYLRNPGMFRSVSAFAPICAPSRSPWGEKAFTAYLGSDKAAWAKYDATELMKTYQPVQNQPLLLVDQGQEDPYMDVSLKPYQLMDACNEVKFPMELRLHEGYDHSYYFVQTFIDDHLNHHAEYLF